MKSILFVCLGNICRSPLAEGIAREYIKQNDLNIKVDSCGTGSWHIGKSPCPNSIKIASMHNIDISKQVARQVSKSDFENFDIVIALDSNNYDDLIKLGCSKEKLYKLGYYGYSKEDIPDPYFFNGFEGFEKVFEMIDLSVKKLLDTRL